MDAFAFMSIQNRILEYELMARKVGGRKHRTVTVERKRRSREVCLRGEKTIIVPLAKNA